MATAICFLLFLAMSSSADAYKALVVYGMPSRSHVILGDGLVRQLLKEGHEVTYITAIEYKNPPPNLRQIDVSSNFKLLPADAISIQLLLEKKASLEIGIMRTIMNSIAANTVKNADVQKLLNDPNEQFDVVIIEWMFSNFLSGIAEIFNCPLIWMSPMEANSAAISLVDAAPNPAYSNDVLSHNMPPFTFMQRLEELWLRIKINYLGYMYYDEMEAKEYEKLIAPLIVKRGRVAPSFDVVRYNASLQLGNSHVSMGQALSLPQNYKAIGGYHINNEVMPLPEDLKKIMESAKNGVIYFSMGSNLRSKDWPEAVKRDLLKMFGELKQTVIWKFEEDLPNVPKNVHILKWAPQPSILSHPKCVLFITHGGLLSTTETIHYGVPIIGIPVFGDQFVNVKRAVKKGFALEVNLSYNTAVDLKVAIEEMLYNPTYRMRVKELSFIYHDRPVKPAVEMLHWIRHVVNTRGALHLRSPALGMPLYQRLYLDLLSLIVVILVVLTLLLKRVCAVVLSKKKAGKQKKKE